MTSSFAHCRKCGVAVPQGATLCGRCDRDNLMAIAQTSLHLRRLERAWEKRRTISRVFYVAAWCWLCASVLPALDQGSGVASSLAVLGVIVGCGVLIAPKGTRP